MIRIKEVLLVAIVLSFTAAATAYALTDGFDSGMPVTTIGADGENYEGEAIEPGRVTNERTPEEQRKVSELIKEIDESIGRTEGLPSEKVRTGTLRILLEDCETEASAIQIVLYDDADKRYNLEISRGKAFSVSTELPVGTYNVIGAYPVFGEYSVGEEKYYVAPHVTVLEGESTVLTVTRAAGEDKITSAAGTEGSAPEEEKSKSLLEQNWFFSRLLLAVAVIVSAVAMFVLYRTSGGSKKT